MSNNIIIGAGPAGLTAAFELSKQGSGSIIFEADNQVGGISRTVNYKGFRFDIGGHRFFTKVPYIQELWEEILKDNFLVRPRLSRIHYRGSFYDYPLKAMNALTNLGLMESVMVMLSYAKVKFRPNREESNFEQWVTNRFGSRLYNIFFKTYTEKVWGIPCTEISEDWAAQRIKNLSLREAVRRSLFGNGLSNGGKVITSLIEQFYYPKLGPGMLWEHCAEQLTDSGDELNYGVKIDRVCHRQNNVDCIVGRNTRGEVVEIGGENFISTMPLRELILSLDPAPPDDILDSAKRLRYRDYLTVVLIVDRENIFPDNWIYIHTPEVRMGRIQNYKNWSPAMVPDSSKTSLGLEYFFWEHDEEWQWSPERLIELGIQECSSLGLIKPAEIEDGTLVRMKKTYPVYDQQYHNCLVKIKDYLTKFSNLQTIGRNGLHRYNNMDHSMLTGVYAARNLMGGKHDVWTVNTEVEYGEEIVQDKRKPMESLKPAPVPETVAEPVESGEKIIDTLFEPIDPWALGVSLGLVSGLGLFLATAALLIKGGEVVGPSLSLLGQYMFGFKVTWTGAFIGLFEAGFAGFVLGQLVAHMRNWGVQVFAKFMKRRLDAQAEREFLEKI